MFDWNDLRFFLELQRSGRLLTAAQRLKTTHATVARHIEAIEKSLGTALFVQHAQLDTDTPAEVLLVGLLIGRIYTEMENRAAKSANRVNKMVALMEKNPVKAMRKMQKDIEKSVGAKG